MIAQTGAASNIDTDSAKLNGEAAHSNEFCCDPDPAFTCAVARRFYWGASSPPGTLTSAGITCSPDLCSGGVGYSKTITGLTSDKTYYFRANVSSSSGSGCTGCSGGSCGGSDNGDIESFQTCMEDVEITEVTNEDPGDTTAVVSITLAPRVRESTCAVKVQYKLDTEPTTWTDGSTQALNQYGFGTLSFTLTGLTAGTAYDYRFVITRTGSCGDGSTTSDEGAFTTVANDVPLALTGDGATATDAFSLTIEGQGALETSGLLLTEDASVFLSAGEDTIYSGVWFYHLPTRSFWFWNFDNFTAAVNDTDADDKARLFVALGSTVYVADDDEYYFDDRDQNRPLDEQTEREIEITLVPKAVDLGDKHGRIVGVDVKWGAPPTIPDPYGKVEIQLITDTYPKRPIPPDSRKVLASRRADIAPNFDGIDEWRHYAVPRTRPSNVVGIRFTFPSGLTPKRVAPIEIEAVRLVIEPAPYRRRRQ